ncbi:stage III sporulation protein SpoIIIAB [Fictibacillus iocasae]|uniref:Stage III sporulation protein SpoIIIAB n=1 Tax=Fictibacillus iocasae TaxID=2715437 RepID=A0ABW2NMA6_9BACL
MSWAGACFVIMACTLFGFERAARTRNRLQQLRNLKVSLMSLEAEIVYALMPLDEAFYHLSGQVEGALSRFFLSVSEKMKQGQRTVDSIWIEEVEVLAREADFEKKETEILKQFGLTLGRHDRDNQQRQIQLALTHLSREEQEARDMAERYEKMYKSVGFLAGLLIVILLL